MVVEQTIISCADRFQMSSAMISKIMEPAIKFKSRNLYAEYSRTIVV